MPAKKPYITEKDVKKGGLDTWASYTPEYKQKLRNERRRRRRKYAAIMKTLGKTVFCCRPTKNQLRIKAKEAKKQG